MAYRALRDVYLGDGVTVPAGEFVLVAVEWSNINVWLRAGYIEEVSDSELPQTKTSAPKKAAEKATPAPAPAKRTQTKKE